MSKFWKIVEKGKEKEPEFYKRKSDTKQRVNEMRKQGRTVRYRKVKVN